MNKVRIISGIAVVTALTIAVATPAMASTNVTIEGTDWSLQSTFDFGFEQIGASTRIAPHGAYAGDGMSFQLEDPATPGSYLLFNCPTEATETLEDDGDFRVDCNDPTALLGGALTFDASLSLFSGDYRGLVGRSVYTLTNTTASDLILNLRYDVNTEECNSGVGTVATSSGDLALDISDSWLVCNNNDSALENHVWGDQWMTSFEDASGSGGTVLVDQWLFENDAFVLAAGESATFVFFLYSEGATEHGNTFGDTDANVIANATGYFSTDALYTSRLWEDLGEVANWNAPAPVVEKPTLAETGADVNALLLAAFALAGLGALVLVRRRTTKA